MMPTKAKRKQGFDDVDNFADIGESEVGII
jgi:hypothetical protein